MSTTAFDAGGSRSAASSAYLVGLLGVAILLSYIDRGLLAVSGPLLKAELGLSATEFVEDARLDTKELQVLYRDANGVHVMAAGTYDQYTLDEETIGDQGQWMEPGLTFQAEWLGGRPIAIQLPAVAELEVVETAPIMKTATKTASTKPAKLSNGVTIQVPEFIGEGERVRVNPREGVYLERAK